MIDGGGRSAKGAHEKVPGIFRALIVFALALPWTYFYFHPILGGGFSGDDQIIHCLFAKLLAIKCPHPSLAAYFRGTVLDDIAGWAKSNGRFNPVSLIELHLTRYFLHDDFAYRFFTIVMVSFNLALFYLLLEAFSENIPLSFAAALSVPFFIQLRDSYHDPIIAYHGLIPVLWSFWEFTVYCLWKYVDTNKPRLLGISLACFALALLTHESSFVLLAIIPAIVFLRKGKFNLGSFLSTNAYYLILAGFLLAVTLYVRSLAEKTSTMYAGVAVRIDYSLMLRTFYLQIVSAMPLSMTSKGGSIYSLLLIVGAALATASVEVVKWKRAASGEAPRYSNVFMFLGLMLWLLPAVPVALAQKYQHELAQVAVGNGYILVYIQVYGLVLLLSGIFLNLLAYIPRESKWIQRALIVSTSGSLAILGCANWRQNREAMRRVTINYNQKAAFRQDFLKAEEENGLDIDTLYRIYITEKDKYLYNLEPVSFSGGGNGGKYLIDGWANPDDSGVMSIKEKGDVFFQLQPHQYDKDLVLEIEGFPSYGGRKLSQTVDVSINGRLISTLNYEAGASSGTRTVDIPRQLIGENRGRAFIRFAVRKEARPMRRLNAKPLTVKMDLMPLVAKGALNEQNVIVSAGGRRVASFAAPKEGAYSFLVPADAIKDNMLKLVLEIPKATSPRKLKLWDWDSTVGIFLKSITIVSAGAPLPPPGKSMEKSKRIEFTTKEADSRRFLLSGWEGAYETGTWSSGTRSVISLPVDYSPVPQMRLISLALR